MVTERVSLLTIGSKDVPSLRKFYQKIGWSETEFSSDSYAVFRTAGVCLTLFPLEELAKDSGLNVSELATGYQRTTIAINVDSEAEVDEAIEAIRAAGANILREPSTAFWGGRTAYFADPERNIWEVAYNPSSVFDERGAMLEF